MFCSTVCGEHTISLCFETAVAIKPITAVTAAIAINGPVDKAVPKALAIAEAADNAIPADDAALPTTLKPVPNLPKVPPACSNCPPTALIAMPTPISAAE